ncbi:MAG: nitroreductase [Dehalococcoidia bacterium]|nr:nitroreductase [Dehalococcoidia bacterium]
MDLFDAMHTQRAIRRYKSDPVPDEVIHKVLDAAIRAPTGSNSQSWSFIVLQDPKIKQQVAEYYKRAWITTGGVERYSDGTEPARVRLLKSVIHLTEHMGEVPVLILCCVRGSGAGSITSGSSIYPAVQNLMLAARGLGLGTCLTTLHRNFETEIKALVGIPNDVSTAALIPMGYPADTVRFGPTPRQPVNTVAFRDHWGNSAF